MTPTGHARYAAPVACRNPQPAALARLVCFPHSGGGPMAFRDWAAGLAPDVELWSVTLPGRAGRGREPFAREWPPLVDETAAAIASDVPGPVALFGHSLGALLAFEVARALTRKGVPPQHLFVSARSSPDTLLSGEVPASDAELLSEIDRVYGGVPDLVRASPELLRHFLPILRADLDLAVAYAFRPGPPLACPITVLAGSDDPTVSDEGLSRWARHTSATCEVHRLSGGHFYLGEHEQTVLATVLSRILKATRLGG